MRVKFDIPEHRVFEADYQVVITDINYGNHLGNDRVLSIAHESRVRWLRSLGYRDEIDFPNGSGTIVADAAIMYKAEAFYGDVLTVGVYIDGKHARGFDMYFRLTRKADGVEIARVKNAVLFFNYKERKLASIPEKLAQQIWG